MARVLVVDDSPTQALQVQGLLEQAGHEVETAANGLEALRAIASGPRLPELVVTDLAMPEMNGLDLVREVRRRHPLLPVILMTAFGSEEVALEALREGAASYVPKKNLVRDLVPTAETVLQAVGARRRRQRLLECLRQTESRFVLENDPGLIPALIGHLTEGLRRMRLCARVGLVGVSVALSEALESRMHQGNLEVPAELRERDASAYQQLLQERRVSPPYRERRVHVLARESPAEAVYVIAHEGPPVRPERPGKAEAPDLENVSRRGLLLMRTFMDEVRHAEAGNEITLVKRRRR